MKKISILIILLIISGFLFGQSVVKEELFKVNRESVEFVNYEGPHDKFETAQEIRGIGLYLGNKYEPSNYTRSYNDRYSIVHLFDPEGQGLLNGDIFSIEKDAVVDNINNVRRILAGYLQSAYSYSKEDSDILAEFASYYNAVYRGNFQYFVSSYNTIVINNLDPKKAGISTRYLDWPGNTQMIIPLTPSGEKAISIDTIGNKTVIEDLRGKQDKGIEPRKAMVELKEKDIAEEQKKIESQKDQLSQEETKLAAEKNQLHKDTSSLTDKEIADKEAVIAQKELVNEAKKEKIKKDEDTQQVRQNEVKKERALIAKDENKLIEDKLTGTKASSVTAGTIPFLIIDKSSPDLLGQICLINTETGKIEKRSSVNTVRGRRYYFLGDKLLIISGVDKAPQTVRLLLLDPGTLEVLKQGNFDVFSDTDVLIKGNSIFTVVRENDSWYLGRFNTDLVLQSRSSQEVLSYSPLQLNNDVIYVQSSSGEVITINPDTLK